MPDGRPTRYFIQWAQQKQIDISAGITAEQALQIIEQYLADHQLQAGTGISISPSGNLTDSPTIAAQVQVILDQITTAQGSVLFRGASDWEALAPGTSGYFLKTNGAAADPAWAAGGGGGGAGYSVYDFFPQTPHSLLSNGANTGANVILVTSRFAEDAVTLTGVNFFQRTNSATRTIQPIIYADNGGTPAGGALIATGPTATLTDNTLHVLPLDSPASLSADTYYWVGVLVVGTGGSFNPCLSVTTPYAYAGHATTTPPDPCPAVAGGTNNNFPCWGY